MQPFEVFCLRQIGITHYGFDELNKQQVALKRRVEGNLGGEFIVNIP